MDFYGNKEIFNEDTDNYLGSVATIDAIVRNFLTAAISVRADWLAGEKSAEDPEKWLKERTAKEARRLLGQDNSSIPVDGWNRPTGGIVDGIRRRFDLKPAEPETIVAYPFYWLVQSFMEAEAEAAAGRDWEHMIDGAIALVVATLMGTDELNFPFEPSGGSA